MRAFWTPQKSSEYLYLPFGLKNAPATFQKVHGQCTLRLPGSLCQVYLNDLIVYSSTTEEHVTHLECIFQALRQAGLPILQMRFHTTSCQYLGHLNTLQGVRPSLCKIEAISELEPCRITSEVRAFLGLAEHYRRFVPQYATIAAPLNGLLHNDTAFQWTPGGQMAFQTLKHAITDNAFLHQPEYTQPCIVQVHYSGTALGAIQPQRIDGVERPRAFQSCSLRTPEKIQHYWG